MTPRLWKWLCLYISCEPTPTVQAGVALPPQLRRLVDGLLQENRCQQPGLFVYKGVEQEVQGIREAIDSGADFPPHCTHSMIEVS